MQNNGLLSFLVNNSNNDQILKIMELNEKKKSWFTDLNE